MKDYIDTALAFIESEEMRDYLREELPKLRGAAMDCAQIVAFAPAPIEKKLPVLEQIARDPDPEVANDGKPFTEAAARYARSCRIALDERYNYTEGAVFLLESDSYDKDKQRYIFDRAFFTDFNAALRYLEHTMDAYPEAYVFEGFSYTITKYVPDGKGQLVEYCIWYLNNMREIWYFKYEHFGRKQRVDRWKLFNSGGSTVTYLPVPFQPGDIIVADCLPYAPPRRVLVLTVGDNMDCCCLLVLFIQSDGCLNTAAFKHNQFLRGGERSPVSGLYRAARWNGELTAGEEAFAVLSPLLRARPEVGEEIENFIWRRQRDKLPSWQELKDHIAYLVEGNKKRIKYAGFKIKRDVEST